MDKILIIDAHCCNRGDEAAVKAMVDELAALYPDSTIDISIQDTERYPCMHEGVSQIDRFPLPGSMLHKVEFMLCYASGGRIAFTKETKFFLSKIKESDIVIHAPGGPSIGDTYKDAEMVNLMRLNLIRRMHKKYMFYAMSIGPFHDERRNPLRKKILAGAEGIILRDPISYQYVKEFVPEMKPLLTLDSALQHDIDMEENAAKLDGYPALKDFMESHERCIGVTITDLLWHPVHGKNPEMAKRIMDTFNQFLRRITGEGYAIIFIPQLYGKQNDSVLMHKFMLNERDFFCVSDSNERFDSYFQQYVISKCHAVVGMRYHSNIFSAKMGIPFISVSYEQKMLGFMQKMKLSDYCIPIEELNFERLLDKFVMLEQRYDEYKMRLISLHGGMRAEAYKSTLAVKEILDGAR